MQSPRLDSSFDSERQAVPGLSEPVQTASTSPAVLSVVVAKPRRRRPGCRSQSVPVGDDSWNPCEYSMSESEGFRRWPGPLQRDRAPESGVVPGNTSGGRCPFFAGAGVGARQAGHPRARSCWNSPQESRPCQLSAVLKRPSDSPVRWASLAVELEGPWTPTETCSLAYWLCKPT
jgi:hypothetical protein